MKHEDGHFPGHDGTSLYWQSWRPDEQAAAALVLIHGHGEHSGRYSYSVKRLTAAGIAVFAFDQRGHGKSPELRGNGKPRKLRAHINSISDYREDVAAFKKRVDTECADIPRFLFGHSMGSVVVLDFIMRNPSGFKGVITSGLGTEPGGAARDWMFPLVKILSPIWPRFPIPLDVDADDLTSMPAEITEYEKDKLIHHKATARWGAEMLKAVEYIKAHPPAIQLPIFLQHGEADKVNFPSGSEKFKANLTSPDATLNTYPDCLHDIHRDKDKEKVLTDLVDWIKARP